MGFLREELVSPNGFTIGDNLQDTRSSGRGEEWQQGEDKESGVETRLAWPGTGASGRGECVCACVWGGGHRSWFLNLEFPGCKSSPQSIAIL